MVSIPPEYYATSGPLRCKNSSKSSALNWSHNRPNSPDLAPNHLWPFQKMKKSLRGCNISSRSRMESAIYQWALYTPEEIFSTAFPSWVDRSQDCITHPGDCVEKWETVLPSWEFPSVSILSTHVSSPHLLLVQVSLIIFNHPALYCSLYSVVVQIRSVF